MRAHIITGLGIVGLGLAGCSKGAPPPEPPPPSSAAATRPAAAQADRDSAASDDAAPFGTGTLDLRGPDGATGEATSALGDGCRRVPVTVGEPVALLAGRHWLTIDIGNGDLWQGPVDIVATRTVTVEIPDGPAGSVAIDDALVPLSRGLVVKRAGTEGAFDAQADSEKAQAATGFPMFGVRRSDDRTVSAREAVNAVVLHASQTTDAASSWKRYTDLGISTHFILDREGTLYQPLDLRFEAYHAGIINPRSVSVELVHPAANYEKTPGAPDPNAGVTAPDARYAKRRSFKINGTRFSSHGGTPAQRRTLEVLLVTLARSLPGLDGRFPLGRDGEVDPNIADQDWRPVGLLAHWHLELDRYDPGMAVDWKSLERSLRAACVWGESGAQ